MCRYDHTLNNKVIINSPVKLKKDSSNSSMLDYYSVHSSTMCDSTTSFHPLLSLE